MFSLSTQRDEVDDCSPHADRKLVFGFCIANVQSQFDCRHQSETLMHQDLLTRSALLSDPYWKRPPLTEGTLSFRIRKSPSALANPVSHQLHLTRIHQWIQV